MKTAIFHCVGRCALQSDPLAVFKIGYDFNCRDLISHAIGESELTKEDVWAFLRYSKAASLNDQLYLLEEMAQYLNLTTVKPYVISQYACSRLRI